jgi:hypothetical protein
MGNMQKMRFLFFLTLLAGSLFASIDPQLQLYNYTISESPAVPGDTVTVTIHLRNIEFANCADTISVQAITSYPLSVSGLDTKYLPDLCLGDPIEKGTVSFDIPVDSLAQSGTFPLTIVTNYEKQFDKFTATNTVNVRVLGVPSVSASATSSQPADVYPGDNATVTVTFQNNGTGRIQSGHVSFSAPAGLEVKWAGAEQDIGEIKPHASLPVIFTIGTLKNAAPGIYPITAVLDYTGDGTPSAEQTFTFNMPIKPKADFSAAAAAGTVLNSDSDKEVTIVLTNTGTQEARKVKVRIQPIFPFSTDGTVRYIDSLPPGGSQELSYQIHVDKDATPGSQLSGLIVDYEDPQGNKFSDSADFALDVKTKTLIEAVMSYWYVFAIIFFIIALVILRIVLRMIGRIWKQAKESR